MEALKEIFEDGALNFDEFSAKVAERKWKLADLSGGAYVGKDKFDTLSAERDNLKARLDEANSKLEGYDPEWKAKAQQAQIDAQKEMEGMQRKYAIREQVSSLKFSSESAKKAFVSELENQNLAMQDGKLLGLGDFVAKYKEDDPNAFLPDTPAPQFAAPGHGKQPVKKEDSMLAEKYKNNPFFKPKGD